MVELGGYTPQEVAYEGHETRVWCAIHEGSGARVAIKVPVAEVPSPRVLGSLLHEHQVLGQLAAVPGVARARALEQRGGTAALVLEDPGFPSLERELARRGRLPVAAGLRLGGLLAACSRACTPPA